MLELALSLLINQPTTNDTVFGVDNSIGMFIETSVNNNAYIWGNFLTDHDIIVLGQKISNSKSFSAGLGYSLPVAPKINAFIELGYEKIHLSSKETVQQEIAYTYLVGRHNVYNRPIPVSVTHPYDQTSYATEWGIGNNIVTKVGVEFEINDNIDMSIGYKFFRPSYKISVYDEAVRSSGGGYWTEKGTFNMNSVEFKLSYNF